MSIERNPDTVTVDPSARRVVNTNFNITNIVDMQESKEYILNTLTKCIDILKSHCGPQSGYAMLVNDMSAGTVFEPNFFTRDGIRILSAVEMVSPLERYIKDMITYIGTRVDSNAKDGTTTSMLISCAFLKYVLERHDIIQSLGFSLFQINTLVDQVFTDYKKSLSKFKFDLNRFAKKDEELTEAEAMTIAGRIAFMQALSSSGGNVELAYAMKEIFEQSPRVAWDFIVSHQSMKETGRSFQVEVDEYDSRIKSIVVSQVGLNHALSTEYLAEDVDVILYPEGIMEGNFNADNILTYVKEHAGLKPMIVISTYFAGRFTTEIDTLNSLLLDSEEKRYPVVLWQYSPEERLGGQNYPWELLALAAIAGIEPYNFDEEATVLEAKHIFTAKKVHWHDTYLELYGVVPDKSSDTCLHPFYADPSKATKFYKDTLEAVNEQIKMYKEGHKPDGKMFNLFITILNKLACIHRPMLRLGGPVHEQVANTEVVQDVQGAIMSTLNKGCYINGVFSLFLACSELGKSYTFSWKVSNPEKTGVSLLPEQKIDIMKGILLGALVEATKLVVDTLLAYQDDNSNLIRSNLSTSIENMAADTDLYWNTLDPDMTARTIDSFMEKVANLKEVPEEYTEEMFTLGRTYPVMHPAVIVEELLKRIQELLVKVLNTNKFVISGGLILSDEDKKKHKIDQPVEEQEDADRNNK